LENIFTPSMYATLRVLEPSSPFQIQLILLLIKSLKLYAYDEAYD
jgi:hypothetical protein